MINSFNNTIYVSGDFNVSELHRFLAALHNLNVKCRCNDIILDFSECSTAFSGPMLAVCAQVSKLTDEDVDIELILPNKELLRRLFVNANWAYIIDPHHHSRSTYKGRAQIPATQFKTSDEQYRVVNLIMEKLLESLTDFSREDMAAIEWSLNEITDNVINHSNSQVGGFVQLTTFHKNKKRIEYVVCDSGIGIPSSLRQAKPELTSDSEAIHQSIQEGVTRNKSSNQGNGLFGTYQIASVSEGSLEIHSGYGSLTSDKRNGLHIRNESTPFAGTLLMASIDYSSKDLLGKALKFGGKIHYPVDFIENKFETENGEIRFSLKNEASSFGSRKAAEPINIKLKNLSRLSGSSKIILDFKDIAVISSSFADEVFGKLFVEMGPLLFMQKFEFRNISTTVRSLIDRAITLRSSTGL